MLGTEVKTLVILAVLSALPAQAQAQQILDTPETTVQVGAVSPQAAAQVTVEGDLIRLWDLGRSGAHTVTPIILIIVAGVTFPVAALLTAAAGSCFDFSGSGTGCTPNYDYTAAGGRWGIGGAVLAGGITWLVLALDSNGPRNQEMTEVRQRLRAAGIDRPDREARRYYLQRRRGGHSGLGFVLQASF